MGSSMIHFQYTAHVSSHILCTSTQQASIVREAGSHRDRAEFDLEGSTVASSVWSDSVRPKLCEISPLWPTFKSVWLFLEGLYFCQNVQSTSAISYATFEKIFVVEFAKYRKHNLAVWSHWIQIGLFLKGLGDKISYKSGPSIWQQFFVLC